MTNKTKAKLAGAWVIFTLALSAIACGGSTEELCPKACREVDLVYHSATATTCNCLKGDGEVVRLW